MGVEIIVGGVSQVGRNNTTEKNTIHLVVDRVRLVPCKIDSQSQTTVYAEFDSLIEGQQDQRPIRVEVGVLEQRNEPVL